MGEGGLVTVGSRGSKRGRGLGRLALGWPQGCERTAIRQALLEEACSAEGGAQKD